MNINNSIKMQNNKQTLNNIHKITVPRVFLNILVLLFISVIIGYIFKDNMYYAIGYFSGLSNAILGPVVIGVAFILFFIVKNLFDYWYMYPFAIFFSTGTFITKDDISVYVSSGANIGLVSAFSVFCNLLFFYGIILLKSYINKRYLYTNFVIVIAVAAITIPFVTFIVNNYIIAEIKKPSIETLTDGSYATNKPSVTLKIDGITTRPYGIKYDEYFDVIERQLPTKTYEENIYISDSVSFKKVKYFEKSKTCKYAAISDGSSNKSVAYISQTTDNGNSYSKVAVKRVTSKSSDGKLTFADTFQYCFVISNTEYTITRDLPMDDNSIPKRSTAEAAYNTYPIEAIVDAFYDSIPNI